ncbi:FKBP-type peptidyl-prolyl cis-trans isomerase [Reichenbachiella carrageenanivorans]|uniref:Peptidyl-prolyl cis-trans isomerase n=1 Tax=Reichenbachiella carrageenanivorans TaxID=2979869 RepID=A0ABY6D0Q3_9BACT|nr:FKBP-type peptidyl-prolyl cis-trans isomerase [Reichenbachiella carrageenanivorans]UXX79756.1 FKBP-type peptidyl-prolyl cis-trans isomerase [Reichenbachiella carrageenanivorans]
MKLSVIICLIYIGLAFASCDNEPEIGSEYDLVALDSTRVTIAKYLETNKITDYKTTSSGIVYVINDPGTGDFPTKSQTVTVHYTGYHLEDDAKFDSSYDRNEAFSFLLGEGQVIPGWDEGIALFKKGGKGTLYIPYQLAYGVYGYGTIGPLEDLKFDIHLIGID